MKLLLRTAIILAVSMLGELLSALLPLPVPGSVYGLILMLVALCTRIIPVDRVLAPGRFLIELMPVMFVPAAAGLIDSWPTLRPMLLPLTVIMVVSTFVVMAAAGHATQAVLRRKPRKEARK